MKTGPRYPRTFYERSCLEVAPALVGAFLGHRLAEGTRLLGRIVEVEAYLGDGTDPAAHSHRGPTDRNRTMFGPPGRLYAYRSYGIHVCVNVVCGAPGSAAAVLLRAVEPIAGLDAMRRLRGLRPDAPARQIARGPGRLGAAMGLALDLDGASLLRGPLGIWSAHAQSAPPRVERGPRVGITRAAAHPYRFFEVGSPWVSPFRAGAARAGKKTKGTKPAKATR